MTRVTGRRDSPLTCRGGYRPLAGRQGLLPVRPTQGSVLCRKQSGAVGYLLPATGAGVRASAAAYCTCEEVCVLVAAGPIGAGREPSEGQTRGTFRAVDLQRRLQAQGQRTGLRRLPVGPGLLSVHQALGRREVGAGHVTPVLLLMLVPFPDGVLSEAVALQGLQDGPGGAGVHGDRGLLRGPVFPVLVAVPVLVLHHPAVGHLGGDARVGAHGEKGRPAGREKGLLPKQLMLLLVVLGGVLLFLFAK